jgi:hypothetical protein
VLANQPAAAIQFECSFYCTRFFGVRKVQYLTPIATAAQELQQMQLSIELPSTMVVLASMSLM